jgi:uncharacterized protein YndB with AHSA1/START domain
MPGAEAKLEEVDGRAALRFERALPHPPERVWRALTDVDEQGAWHPTPARIEPRVGGAVEWRTERFEHWEPGEVTAYEPPRLLAYTWSKEESPDPDLLRWELRPHDEGCLLILVHSFGDRLKAARDGAGWHVCLDSLAASLDARDAQGVPSPRDGNWRELNAHYQEKFGISPEEATPVPERRS